MPTVVGVSFKPVTKVYYFDPAGLPDLQAGEYVVVETSQGFEVGQISWQPRLLPDSEISGELKPVVRRATPVDLVERDNLQQQQRDVLQVCRAKARDHRLPMRVVSADYSFDGSRLVVSFTSEGRVDFRDLVRDLAKTFNARIEMKQIGVRDEAKVLDGVGKCGCRLCCSAWLREFNPVTVKMAKQQNLPLNPPEISGVCGRLLCCLAYEANVYTEARKELPKVGAMVMTPDGEGNVRKVHPLREVVTVRFEDGAMREFPVDQLGGEPMEPAAPTACSNCARKQPAAMPHPAPAAPMPSSKEPAPTDAAEPAPKKSRSRRRRHKPSAD